MHKYIFATPERNFDVFMDTEDLGVGQCVVIGSSVYQIRGMSTTDDGIVCNVRLISDKLYVGMLSEW